MKPERHTITLHFSNETWKLIKEKRREYLLDYIKHIDDLDKIGRDSLSINRFVENLIIKLCEGI